VFNGSNGKLIDFDFGGPAGRCRYPPGYVQDLPDGFRVGQEMQHIKEYDKWAALASCMFSCHQFRASDTSKDTFVWRVELADRIGDSAKTPGGLAAYIRDICTFLADTKDLTWGCTRQFRFQQALCDIIARKYNPATDSLLGNEELM
jgi:hypothetical protein